MGFEIRCLRRSLHSCGRASSVCTTQQTGDHVIGCPYFGIATVGKGTTNAARQRNAEPSYLLGEDVFRAALRRELKRVDRFDESFALLIISSADGVREATWRELVEALTRVKSDTDMIGWWKQDVGSA